MKDRYKHFIFDLDGVLVDSKEMYLNAIIGGCREAGIEINKGGLAESITPDIKVWVDSMISLHGKKTVKKIIDSVREYVCSEGWEVVVPVENADNLVNLLAEEGKSISLVSNSPSVYANKVLERMGIHKYFGFRISCPEQRIDKQEGIKRAIEKSITNPSRAVYLCDTAIDIFFASKAGVDSICIFSTASWDYPHRERVEGQKPFLIASSIGDIIKLLKDDAKGTP